MSTIGKYNGVSAYDVKHNGINDIKSMNGVYAPSVFDTTNIELYIDPLDTNSYNGGTSFNSALQNTNTGTFFGGMESGFNQGGWFDTDAVNDYALLPSFNIGGQYSVLMWNYADRTDVNIYLDVRTSASNGGVRIDIGSNLTFSWCRYITFHTSGVASQFTNEQPHGYWYLQYMVFQNTQPTKFGASKPDGTFTHVTGNSYTSTTGTASIRYWGNSPGYGFYSDGKVGQMWWFNRLLTTQEIEGIYQNTKNRYGY